MYIQTPADSRQIIEPPTALIRAWEGPLLCVSLALMGLFFYLAFNSYWRPINNPKQQPLKITLTAPAPKPKTEARPEAPAAIKQPPKPSKAKVISANKPAEPSPKPELKQVPQAPATRLNLAIPQDLLEPNPAPSPAQPGVFDSKLAQRLNSPEIMRLNGRQQSHDLGNYTSVYGDNFFSDGKGNCFRVLEHFDETLWMQTRCQQKRVKTRFGRRQ